MEQLTCIYLLPCTGNTQENISRKCKWATQMRISTALSYGASQSDSCAYMSESTEQQACITTSAEISRCSRRGVHTVLSRWMCNLGPSCLVHIGASQMVCRWGGPCPAYDHRWCSDAPGCRMHWGVCTPRQTGARLGTPRLKWCIKICKCAHDHFGTATTIQGFGCREAFGWSQFMCLSLKL